MEPEQTISGGGDHDALGVTAPPRSHDHGSAPATPGRGDALHRHIDQLIAESLNEFIRPMFSAEEWAAFSGNREPAADPSTASTGFVPTESTEGFVPAEGTALPETPGTDDALPPDFG